MRPKILWLSVLLTFGCFAVSAGPMNVKATLVWGTDQEKPDDPKLKPADPKMVKDFREMCKWKHYFEVTNTMAVLNPNAATKIRLSPKCEVEVVNVGKMGLEAKVFGEGKLIYSGKSQVEAGKHWGIGGPVSTNQTAWFVVLTPQ